jgi:hypothetical protein
VEISTIVRMFSIWSVTILQQAPDSLDYEIHTHHIEDLLAMVFNGPEQRY